MHPSEEEARFSPQVGQPAATFTVSFMLIFKSTQSSNFSREQRKTKKHAEIIRVGEYAPSLESNRGNHSRQNDTLLLLLL